MRSKETSVSLKVPYKQNERLWVRETWAETESASGIPIIVFRADESSFYIGPNFQRLHDCPEKFFVDKWKSPLFMYKAIARIWLQVDDVKIERLHQITTVQAVKEGIERRWFKEINKNNGGFLYRDYSEQNSNFWVENPTCSIKTLWDLINGQETWDKNVWVWVINFKILSITGKTNSF